MTDRPIEVADVAAALEAVRDRIRRAGGTDVQILAVTKGFGPDAIVAAVAAGCPRIGENYTQDLLAKRAEAAAAEVHFIGRLQSNKIRQLAGVVDVYASVDRESLVREIARRAPGARILVQVNATDETDKGGCAPQHVEELVAAASAAGLRVEGLMTVGPTSGGPDAAREPFRIVRRLTDALGLERCSMGMSGDLEIAVAEGTDEVRIGTALFGVRPPASRPPRS